MLLNKTERKNRNSLSRILNDQSRKGVAPTISQSKKYDIFLIYYVENFNGAQLYDITEYMYYDTYWTRKKMDICYSCRHHYKNNIRVC